MRDLSTIARSGARMAAMCMTLALDAPAAAGAEANNPYNDPPPMQATHDILQCPVPRPQTLTPEEARREAHQRVERGTSCWLAGQCEAGGDYKHDGDINARVAAAIERDRRFANTSLWVETLRKFVTIKGCLADAKQGSELEAMVKAIAGVKLVWQEAVVAPDGRR